jgi:DNA repair photolyase
MINKQKGNMYGFVTHTWNTIKGKCFHECSYCYMKKWGKQNPVRFDDKELNTDLGENNFIFVGSSCDMFANDIKSEWIEQTIDHCKKFPKNKYLFQTKNPRQLQFFHFPENTVFCVTIESNYSLDNNFAPGIRERVSEFEALNVRDKMLTIEPIMDFDVDELLDIIDAINPLQVNIGADSGRNGLKEPSAEKIGELVRCLDDAGINYFLKDNLSRIFKK